MTQIFPEIVYHYCSNQTFFEIINHSKLRLTNITKSNDPRESFYLLPYLLEALNSARKRFNNSIVQQEYRISEETITEVAERYFEKINPSRLYCAICFSEEQNKLSQWIKYADNAQGVALGFDSVFLSSLQESQYFLFDKVIYGKQIILDKVGGIFEKLFQNREWQRKKDHQKQEDFADAVYRAVLCFNRYAPFYKDKFFEEECEWRLIFSLNGNINRVNTKDFADIERSFDGNIQDFSYSGLHFVVKDNNLCSYVELDFSKMKAKFLREIIIAPNSPMRKFDGDLQLFLDKQGYKQTERLSVDKLKIIQIEREIFQGR